MLYLNPILTPCWHSVIKLVNFTLHLSISHKIWLRVNKELLTFKTIHQTHFYSFFLTVYMRTAFFFIQQTAWRYLSFYILYILVAEMCQRDAFTRVLSGFVGAIAYGVLPSYVCGFAIESFSSNNWKNRNGEHQKWLITCKMPKLLSFKAMTVHFLGLNFVRLKSIKRFLNSSYITLQSGSNSEIKILLNK